MERRRTTYANQQKRYITLASSFVLLIVNIAIFVCYLKIPSLLLRQSVPLWIFIVTSWFILANIFFIIVFFLKSSLLDGIVHLCIPLILLQLIYGSVTIIIIVMQADNVSDNLLLKPKDLESNTEFKEFQLYRNCCFSVITSREETTSFTTIHIKDISSTSSPSPPPTPPQSPPPLPQPSSPSLSSSLSLSIPLTKALKTQHKECKSCTRVNKEEARNVAIFLSTGYILNIVILSSIFMYLMF